MMIITEIFQALSDSVRLEMVQRLSHGGSYTLGTISNDLGVTRQGARKHLTILQRAELIHLKKNGRTTEVELNVASLEKAKEFISKLEHQWDQRLASLKDFVENK